MVGTSKIVQNDNLVQNAGALASSKPSQKKIRIFLPEQVHQLALNLDELRGGGDEAVAVLIVPLIALTATLFIYLMEYRVMLKKGERI